jgi:hypothetical protein
MEKTRKIKAVALFFVSASILTVFIHYVAKGSSYRVDVLVSCLALAGAFAAWFVSRAKKNGQ